MRLPKPDAMVQTRPRPTSGHRAVHLRPPKTRTSGKCAVCGVR